MNTEIKLSQKLDQNDQLKDFKKEFINNNNEIYLDGNSLGKLPILSKIKIKNVVENEWGNSLIRGWNDSWLEMVDRVSCKLEKLFNASKNEIIIGESTSVYLYQVLSSLLNSNKYKHHFISDNLNFPSDLYIINGICKEKKGPTSVIVDYESDIEANLEMLKNSIKNKPGIICLSLVSYKSSWIYPMKELNNWALSHNSIIVWDLSHAAGVVHIDLKKTNTHVAVGCTYKFLNGGPGSPAYLYIKTDLLKSLQNPINGWFGHSNPFSFSEDFDQDKGIKRFSNGTPSILSITPIEIGVDLVLKAGIKSIEAKSKKQSEYLKNLIIKFLIPLGFKLESPVNCLNRGSHISISHSESWRICKSLQTGTIKIIPDYRPPKYIRLGISPLYTSFEDLTKTVFKLAEIVKNKEYLKYSKERPRVT
ncbi:MAG: kynureninase [Candidatus Marivariicella framensis]|jgi:kynureninase|tara:strand:+ start:444 stop:1703 length:1260 start_codon:yes stop_codon:yes gene_type:complete